MDRQSQVEYSYQVWWLKAEIKIAAGIAARSPEMHQERDVEKRHILLQF